MCQKTHEGSQKPVRPKASVPGEVLVLACSAVHAKHYVGSLTNHDASQGRHSPEVPGGLGAASPPLHGCRCLLAADPPAVSKAMQRYRLACATAKHGAWLGGIVASWKALVSLILQRCRPVGSLVRSLLLTTLTTILQQPGQRHTCCCKVAVRGEGMAERISSLTSGAADQHRCISAADTQCTRCRMHPKQGAQKPVAEADRAQCRILAACRASSSKHQA